MTDRQNERELTAVFSAPFLGGSELFNLDYIRRARQLGVEVDAILPARGGLAVALAPHVRSMRTVAVPDQLQRLSRFDAAVPSASRARLAIRGLRYVGALARALKATRGPICCFGFRAQLAVGVLQPFLRRPVLWVAHEVVPEGPFGTVWRRLALRADVVLAYSRTAAEQPLLRGATVRLFPARLQLRAFAAITPPAFPPRRIGLIGDLFPLKNHLEFVEVVESLRAEGLDVSGLIVGRDARAGASADGTYAEAVRAAVDRTNGAVDLVAAAPQEMPSLMGRIDVLFHLTNVPESFGRVCAEAMAAGRPVIAYGHGAVAEVVEDGETGFLCRPGDLSGTIGAFRRVHEDEELFRRLSGRAHHVATSRYGEEQEEASIAEAIADMAMGVAP
jgi:glycosyltransferase involved in cell wall biosynthesis